MDNFIEKTARLSAVIGGVALTALALLITVSIIGGAIAKLGYSDALISRAPSLAEFIQGTGIRTIHGMFEIMRYGIAFVIFAFLPITSYGRAHAVVDIFTHHLPRRLNLFLRAFWEMLFCAVLFTITWMMFFGLERMISSGTVSTELRIPEWWAYLVAFIQMIIATIVSGFVAWSEILTFLTGRDELPQTDGAVH